MNKFKNHSETRLVLYHITHTAGSTLIRMLYAYTNYSFPVHPNIGSIFTANRRDSTEENRQMFVAAPYDFLSHEAFYDGLVKSFPFPRAPSKDAQVTDTSLLFMTILRYPLSMYFRHNWSNFQLWGFNGLHRLHLPVAATREHLRYAMDRLQWFAIILIVEDLSNSMQMLCKQLLWPNCEAGLCDKDRCKRFHGIHSGKKSCLDQPNSALRAAIADHMFDLELYFYGRELSRRQMHVLRLPVGKRALIY